MSMRNVIIIAIVALVVVDAQSWDYPKQFLSTFPWLRKGKNANGTIWTTVSLTTVPSTTARKGNVTATAATTEVSTLQDSTTQDVTVTTDESRDNHRVHDFYINKREKPQLSKITSNISQVSSDNCVQLNER